MQLIELKIFVLYHLIFIVGPFGALLANILYNCWEKQRRISREEKLDREIVKDLKKLGGVPRKTKGDPFKLAKELLEMSQEEYEEILGED